MLSFHWGQFIVFQIPNCLMIQVTLTMTGLSGAVTVSVEICYRQAAIRNLKCPLYGPSKYKFPLTGPFSLGSWVVLAPWWKAGCCWGNSNNEVMGERIWNGKARKEHIPDFMFALCTPGYKSTCVKRGKFGNLLENRGKRKMIYPYVISQCQC